MATTVVAKSKTENDTSQAKGMTFAYVGLVAFLFVYCARPNGWTNTWTALVLFPFAKITAAIAILGLLSAMFTGGRKFLHFPLEVILLFFLFGQLCLSVPFSIWPGGSFEVVFTEFSKVIPIVILIVATSTTVSRVKTLLIVQAGSVALMALFTLLGIAEQEALSNVSTVVRSGGAVGGVFGNSNDFAWALALMFPMAIALLLCTRNYLVKCFWASAMIIMVIALMRTYSRGGTISFIVSGGMIMWLIGLRARKIHLLFIAAAACLLLLVFAAPEGFFTRIASTTDWSQDETVAAWARQHLFMISVKVTMENPLFGIGPGNFLVLPDASWHGTHNTFTQFSSEAGIPALLLFCAILWTSIRKLNLVRKWAAPNDELWILSAGLAASFAGFIVGGFFAMAAYHFFSYFMVGYSCALYKLAQNSRGEGELAQPELRKASMTRRRQSGKECEPSKSPDYSRLVQRRWRAPLVPTPEKTRSGG